MSSFDDALLLAHVIAEQKFDEHADEEESRRDQSGFGGSGDVWHWDDLNESEHLTLAKNEVHLARVILRSGWSKKN